MNLRETYDHMAKDWTSSPWDEGWWSGAITSLTQFLPKGARILDAGCGGGAVVRELWKQGFAAEGFDFSQKMLEIARQRVPQAKFVVADIYDLSGFEDGVYDAIVLQAVLLHIPKKDCSEILRNLVAKLRPGGYLLVAVKQVKLDRPEETIEKDNYFGYEIERFFSYFTMPELQGYLKDQGLKIVFENVETMGPTHWLQLIGHKQGV
jgi:ubiquinone/menaquinone biosynthesis C-methylase UbiE